MAVPRNRSSNARKNSRRAHHAKKPRNITKCRNCDHPRMSHTLCSNCGWYQGRVMVEMGANEE